MVLLLDELLLLLDEPKDELLLEFPVEEVLLLPIEDDPVLVD